MWKYAFFTEEELNQIRTKIPEFDNILAVMGSERVAVVSTLVDDLPDFILGLDDRYIKIINEQFAKLEAFDAVTVAGLISEHFKDPRLDSIVELLF